MPAHRKTDEDHILRGTFRPDRHGDPSKSVVASGEPVPPPSLKGKALECWAELIPQAVKLGTATEPDSAILAAMCRWRARAEKLEAAFDKMPAKAKGRQQALVMACIAHDKWTKIAEQFGLQCLSRTKLRQPAKQTTDGIRTRVRG